LRVNSPTPSQCSTISRVSRTSRSEQEIPQNSPLPNIAATNVNVEVSANRPSTPHPSSGQFVFPDLQMQGNVFQNLAKAIDRMAAVNEPKKRKVVFPEHLKHFTGKDGYQHAMNWWNKLKIFYTTNTSTEEEILCSMRDILEADSPAARWFEARGKRCKTLQQLETVFNAAYGPNNEQLCELKIKIRSQKQQHSQSFMTFSHSILMLNQELGTPYGDEKLLKLIYRNMLPKYKVKIDEEDYDTLEELEVKVARLEKKYLSVDLSKMEEKGHDMTKVETVEQLYEYKNNLKKLPVAPPKTPVFQHKTQQDQRPRQEVNKNQPKQQTELSAVDNKSIISQQNKGDVASKANSSQGSLVTNTSKSSKSFNKTSERGGQPPVQRTVAAFDATRCRNFDRNLTGFSGDVTQRERYNENNQCWTCGLIGFKNTECPKCKTEEEIQQWRALSSKQKTEYFQQLKRDNLAKREAWKARQEISQPSTSNQPKLSDANSVPINQGNEGWGNN